MNFYTKLQAITKKNNSLICVGLDSNVTKIPAYLKSGKNPQFEFNKAIIEATHDLVCAYKPNSAFYEACGSEGIQALKKTTDYIRKKNPEIPIILDAKRADIGNTNEGYIKFAFDWLGVDAITLHPYLGKEALKPFLDRKDKGCFILCKASNLGAGEFQDLQLQGRQKDTSEVAPLSGDSSDGGGNSKPLYQIVAEHVAKDWNYNDNCGLVVGATYPEELEIVRHIVGEMPILIPGIGAQGGDVEKTVKAGIDSNGLNAVINSSRGIIFASSGLDFAQIARQEAIKLKNMINSFRKVYN